MTIAADIWVHIVVVVLSCFRTVLELHDECTQTRRTSTYWANDERSSSPDDVT